MLIRKFVCLGVSVSAITVLAQNPLPAPESVAVGTEPVAYVYVSMLPANSSVHEIVGYAADANGQLTPVPGSPFTADVTSMAVNGLYLFGSDNNGMDVDTYAIESDGSLTLVNQTNVTQHNWHECGTSGWLFLDHTGQDLYDLEYDGNSCANNKYESLGVVKSTGALTNLGSGVYSSWLSLPATFIGNNQFAYSVSCLGDAYWTIFGMVRKSTGELSFLANFESSLPVPKEGVFYCPLQIAADPTNHVAIALQPVSQSSFMLDGGPQIGSFTADSNGNLSSTNTSAEMPVSAVGTALSMAMARSGQLLAVGGIRGLQIFHFNGAGPVTVATGLLTTDEVDQMFWDKANHLYAISTPKGRLHVYTITPTASSEAPGSPYSIEFPQSVIVQPWPLPWMK